MNHWILFAIIVFIIFIDSLGDALRDLKKKKISHLLEILLLCLMAFLGFLMAHERYPIIWVASSYILARIALFSVFYNIIRRQPLTYLGNTDIVDVLLNKFLNWTKFPRHFLLSMNFLCILAAEEIIRHLIF